MRKNDNYLANILKICAKTFLFINLLFRGTKIQILFGGRRRMSASQMRFALTASHVCPEKIQKN